MSEQPAGAISEAQPSASKRENGSKPSEQDPATSYKMNKEKGKCVIINMENFSNKRLNKRNGTDEDVNALEAIFKEMKFEVEILKDKNHDEILDYLEGVAGEDHTERSCFVCIIMSHGNENGIYASDKPFTTKEVFSLFDETFCNTLAGKPKLFFIQACRGDSYDDGVQVCSGADKKPTPEICMDANFLCHYSTPPGYKAWRAVGKERKGSWFIQSLCQMLKEHWKRYDLMHILTLVNNYVAEHYESETKDPKTHQKKQMPCIVSKLTKDLYFYQ